jgi:hypothetical protein
MKPDIKAIVNETAQVEHDLWGVREHVSALIDCHEEVVDHQSWQHPHSDPAKLFDNDDPEPHVVVKHHQGECF